MKWVWLLMIGVSAGFAAEKENFVRGDFFTLNDNGAWSWFMDERLLVDGGRLIVGSVRANGSFTNKTGAGWGNVELSIRELESGKTRVVVLHEHFEQDDHNAPGMMVLGDGRYLAAYTKHGQETKMYYRISVRPHDPYEWGPVQVFDTGGNAGNFRGDSITYCNPIRMTSEGGRIYMLYRGRGLDPNYLISDDDGRSWRYGGKVFIGRDGYSPYAKYAWNGQDTIHVIGTEDHPRNYDNSLYHMFIRGGKMYYSDGREIGPLATNENAKVHAWELTKIYQGGPTNVAWMTDVELDGEERPVVLFTVQRDGAGLKVGKGGMDHRFHYARWDGKAWQVNEIAYAGTRLYAGEDDYTGLGAIDPQETSTVYISTDADPVSGKPLVKAGSSKRVHEIYHGVTRDGGKSWDWTALTRNSEKDNLRPLMPKWKNERRVLVWMRGDYRRNRGEWDTEVVGTMLNGKGE